MSKLTFYYWLFTLCFCAKLNSQSYYKQYLKTIDSINLLDNDPISKNTLKLQKAQINIDRLLSLSEIDSSYNDKAKIASKFAVSFYLYTYEYETAIKYGKIAVDVYENKLKILDSTYSNSLYNLGICYLDNNQLTQAIKTFKKVIKFDNNYLKVGQSYCGIGTALRNAGDVYRSIDYYKKGLSILEKKPVYFTEESFPLAHIYNKINTPASINDKFKLLKQLEDINQSRKLDLYHFLSINNEIAGYYKNERNFDFEKSKDYYFKNLKRVQQENEPYYLSQIYNSIGTLYLKKENDSALFFLKKGLKFNQDKIFLPTNYYQTAKYYLQKENYTQTSIFLDKSLKASLNIPIHKVLHLDSVNLLKQTINKNATLNALITKSEILILDYLKDQESIKPIREALIYLKKAEDLVTKINNIEFEDNSQLYWQEESSKIYSNITLCYYFLKNSKKAFNYIEKGKTYILNQAISENISKYQLPEKFSVKFYELKNKILYLEHTLNNKNIDKNIYQDSLFNVKNKFKSLRDSLKTAFPKYKTIENLVQPETIDIVQKQLHKNSIILSYSWANQNLLLNKIVLTAVTKNSVSSFLIHDTKKIESLIYKLKKLINTPLNTNEDLNNYQKVAFELYKNLFPENLTSLILGKKIIIVPDDELQSIPFEALITKESTSDFLIKKNEVSYAYSLTSMLNNLKVSRNSIEDITSFSPVNYLDNDLFVLKKSENEIENISKLISGRKFLNSEATKDNFLKNSNLSKIIHLGTHASASENPWIAFYDKKLLLHELYTYKTNADLVVLSACETSLGKITKGEGVLSLARGFFYSGANSVISSLWNVNDKSSSEIMVDFYTSLSKGNTKSQALRNAKLNYINKHSLSENSPYYWASFVLIGDTSEVFKTNYTIYYVIIGITLILIITIFYKKRVTDNF